MEFGYIIVAAGMVIVTILALKKAVRVKN